MPKDDETAIIELPLSASGDVPVAVLLDDLRLPVSCSSDLADTTYHVALPPIGDFPQHLTVEYGNGETDALQIPNEIRDQRPASLKDLVDLARRMESQKKLSKALACVNTILAIDPDDFDGNFRKGRILEKQKQEDLAKVHSLRALEVRPGHYRAATTLGRIAMKEKRFDLAVYYYSLVSERHDTYTEACTSIAKALGNLDRTFEAIGFCEKAIAHCPDKWSYRRDAARLMVKTGLLEEAIVIYEDLSKIEAANVTRELKDAYRLRILSKGPTPAMRYRGAFGAERDICICCGPEEDVINFATTMANKIADRTGCRVDVLHSRCGADAEAVSVSRKQYECCMILPEALLDPDFRAPTSMLKFSYLDNNRLESIDDGIAQERYEAWVNGIMGL